MPITRLFASPDDAAAAVADLKQAGFRPDSIEVVTKSDAGAGATAIGHKGVPKANAERYAAAVAEGGALVLVGPPFGTAAKATKILEISRPGDTGTAHAVYEVTSLDEATPLSSAAQIPVLINDPAPLSSYFKIRTLTKEPYTFPTFLGLGLLSNVIAPLSTWLGWPVLSSNPAPLSSAIGAPVASSDPAPLSSSLGWPVLKNDPTPFSNWIGKTTLIDDPTPLSSWLKIPVLLRD
jgi:hypothetical protein